MELEDGGQQNEVALNSSKSVSRCLGLGRACSESFVQAMAENSETSTLVHVTDCTEDVRLKSPAEAIVLRMKLMELTVARPRVWCMPAS